MMLYHSETIISLGSSHRPSRTNDNQFPTDVIAVGIASQTPEWSIVCPPQIETSGPALIGQWLAVDRHQGNIGSEAAGCYLLQLDAFVHLYGDASMNVLSI